MITLNDDPNDNATMIILKIILRDSHDYPNDNLSNYSGDNLNDNATMITLSNTVITL